MTDKKFTDDEIIKDLKQCEECHYYGECEKSVRKALDLINRQKAENERKDRILESYALQYGTATDKEVFLRKAKADAVREFAERSKIDFGHGVLGMNSVAAIIDNLVKEMTEGQP